MEELGNKACKNKMGVFAQFINHPKYGSDIEGWGEPECIMMFGPAKANSKYSFNLTHAPCDPLTIAGKFIRAIGTHRWTRGKPIVRKSEINENLSIFCIEAGSPRDAPNHPYEKSPFNRRIHQNIEAPAPVIIDRIDLNSDTYWYLAAYNTLEDAVNDKNRIHSQNKCKDPCDEIPPPPRPPKPGNPLCAPKPGNPNPPPVDPPVDPPPVDPPNPPPPVPPDMIRCIWKFTMTFNCKTGYGGGHSGPDPPKKWQGTARSAAGVQRQADVVWNGIRYDGKACNYAGPMGRWIVREYPAESNDNVCTLEYWTDWRVAKQNQADTCATFCGDLRTPAITPSHKAYWPKLWSDRLEVVKWLKANNYCVCKKYYVIEPCANCRGEQAPHGQTIQSHRYDQGRKNWWYKFPKYVWSEDMIILPGSGPVVCTYPTLPITALARQKGFHGAVCSKLRWATQAEFLANKDAYNDRHNKLLESMFNVIDGETCEHCMQSTIVRYWKCESGSIIGRLPNPSLYPAAWGLPAAGTVIGKLGHIPHVQHGLDTTKFNDVHPLVVAPFAGWKNLAVGYYGRIIHYGYLTRQSPLKSLSRFLPLVYKYKTDASNWDCWYVEKIDCPEAYERNWANHEGNFLLEHGVETRHNPAVVGGNANVSRTWSPPDCAACNPPSSCVEIKSRFRWLSLGGQDPPQDKDMLQLVIMDPGNNALNHNISRRVGTCFNSRSEVGRTFTRVWWRGQEQPLGEANAWKQQGVRASISAVGGDAGDEVFFRLYYRNNGLSPADNWHQARTHYVFSSSTGHVAACMKHPIANPGGHKFRLRRYKSGMALTAAGYSVPKWTLELKIFWLAAKDDYSFKVVAYTAEKRACEKKSPSLADGDPVPDIFVNVREMRRTMHSGMRRNSDIWKITFISKFAQTGKAAASFTTWSRTDPNKSGHKGKLTGRYLCGKMFHTVDSRKNRGDRGEAFFSPPYNMKYLNSTGPGFITDGSGFIFTAQGVCKTCCYRASVHATKYKYGPDVFDNINLYRTPEFWGRNRENWERNDDSWTINNFDHAKPARGRILGEPRADQYCKTSSEDAPDTIACMCCCDPQLNCDKTTGTQR